MIPLDNYVLSIQKQGLFNILHSYSPIQQNRYSLWRTMLLTVFESFIEFRIFFVFILLQDLYICKFTKKCKRYRYKPSVVNLRVTAKCNTAISPNNREASIRIQISSSVLFYLLRCAFKNIVTKVSKEGKQFHALLLQTFSRVR